MSVDADIKPIGLAVADDGDELDHLVCCNPDRALCGQDVSGWPWEDDVDEPEDCVVCLDLRDRPCGKAFCNIRTWWRNRKSPP